jgi:hypothetical protein
MERGTLGRQVAIRLTEADVQRLEALVQRIPVVSRNGIARAAIRLGLDLLEEDPTRIVQQPVARRGRKPRK